MNDDNFVDDEGHPIASIRFSEWLSLTYEQKLLRELVRDLSAALTDEGDNLSTEGLDRMRRRVACALPLAMLPDWLKPYRPVETAPTANEQ